MPCTPDKTAATAPATLIFLAAAPVASFISYLSSSGPFKVIVTGMETLYIEGWIEASAIELPCTVTIKHYGG